MSWSLIYEKKFPEVIARYLLNHFLLEVISADPSPSFPISYPDDPKFLSFFFHGMLQRCCICGVTWLIQEFILLVKFCIPCSAPIHTSSCSTPPETWNWCEIQSYSKVFAVFLVQFPPWLTWIRSALPFHSIFVMAIPRATSFYRYHYRISLYLSFTINIF